MCVTFSRMRTCILRHLRLEALGVASMIPRSHHDRKLWSILQRPSVLQGPMVAENICTLRDCSSRRWQILKRSRNFGMNSNILLRPLESCAVALCHQRNANPRNCTRAHAILVEPKVQYLRLWRAISKNETPLDETLTGTA